MQLIIELNKNKKKLKENNKLKFCSKKLLNAKQVLDFFKFRFWFWFFMVPKLGPFHFIVLIWFPVEVADEEIMLLTFGTLFVKVGFQGIQRCKDWFAKKSLKFLKK